MPKIRYAEEDIEGYVTSSVEFPDGLSQTVRLPKWATKKNIKDEAQRLRDAAEAKDSSKIKRMDLVET